MRTVRHCSQNAPGEKMSIVCVLLRSEKNQIKIQSLHESCQIQNTVILNNSDGIVCRLRVWSSSVFNVTPSWCLCFCTMVVCLYCVMWLLLHMSATVLWRCGSAGRIAQPLHCYKRAIKYAWLWIVLFYLNPCGPDTWGIILFLQVPIFFFFCSKAPHFVALVAYEKTINKQTIYLLWLCRTN